MATPPMCMAMRTTHVKKWMKAGYVRCPYTTELINTPNMEWSEVTYDALICHPLTMVIWTAGVG